MGNSLIQPHKARVVLGLLCSWMCLCPRLLCLSVSGISRSAWLTGESLTGPPNIRVEAQGHFQCLISQITQFPFMLLTIAFKNQSPVMPKRHRGSLWSWSLQCLSHKFCLLLPASLSASQTLHCVKLLFCLWFSSFWAGQLQCSRKWKANEVHSMLHRDVWPFNRITPLQESFVWLYFFSFKILCWFTLCPP